jgi:hypothetical protein
MGLAHSPKIVTDGLVFYYDMHNYQKSWKGMPITNLLSNNLSSTNSYKTLNYGKYSGTYNGWSATGITNDNPRTVLFNGSINVSSSTFYTLSCLYWSSNSILDDVYLKFSDTGWPESTYYIQPFSSQSVTRNGNFSVTDLNNGWKYCTGTFQTLSTTTTLEQLFFDVDVSGIQVFIANIQFEQNLFATPYVNGTRSNTQSIVDLTNRNTITATSLTYASDETFSFTYSNPSYITIPLSTAFNKTEGTMNFWLYPTRYNGGNGYFVNREDANANAVDWFWIGPYSDTFYFRLGNGSDCCSNDLAFGSVSTVIPLNTWVNMCFTWKANETSAIYKNGTLLTSRSIGNVPATNPASNGRIGLGHANADNYFDGKMPAVQIYNRQFNATEVLQNFNALRGKYGI